MKKLYRIVSGLTNMLLFRSRSVKYGKNLRVLGNVGLENKGEFTIGDKFRCYSGIMVNPMGVNVNSFFSIGEGAKLSIGNNVGVSSVVIWCDNGIEIKDNVKIGARSIITDTDVHSLDPKLRADDVLDGQNAISKPVTIEENAFIGASSIICKGVTIGKNTIIGAGSVVTKSIPDNCVAAGNPCRIVRYIMESQKMGGVIYSFAFAA